MLGPFSFKKDSRRDALVINISIERRALVISVTGRFTTIMEGHLAGSTAM
jgi:hypothetical protein